MAFSGDTGVLDLPGAVDKPLFKTGFLVPTANDITALQGGQGITMSGAAAAVLADLSVDDKLLIRTAGGTKTVSVTVLSQILTATGKPILAREDIGLVGNGVTDDAPALQRACESYSASGGAVFMLRAQPGKSFYLAGTIRGASDIAIIFISPHTVTSTSRITLAGSLARVANADRFKLLADTAQGDSFITVDTSPHGGGLVSERFAVGDILRITGLRDSCGTALEGQEVRVTAITDGTSRLDISPALDFAYKVTYPAGAYEAAQGASNDSLVGRLVTAAATGNVGSGANLWPIANGDVGKFQVGDYVVVLDEKKCSDVAGSDTNPINVEIRRIAASVSGDATNSLRLSSRVERDYNASTYKARLMLISPITNSSVQGASVQFSQIPDPGVLADCFEMRYAVDCAFTGLSVPNADVFGTRGAAYRVFRSLGCKVDLCTAQDAKFVGTDEGEGVVFAWSTDCSATGNRFDGMSHAVRFMGATGCVNEETVVENPRNAPVSHHGCNDRGCRTVNPTFTGGTSWQSTPGSAPPAILFGSTALLAGSHRAGLEGGRVRGFKAEDGNHEAVFRLVPPSTGCWIKGTEFHDVGAFFAHTDVTGAGTSVSSGHRLENVSVDGCASWLVNVSGRANGASVDTLSDVAVVSCRFRNIGKLITATYATELQFEQCEFDEITPDGSFPYLLTGDHVTDLRLIGNACYGAARGLKLTTCTNFRVIGNTFADQTATTVLLDNGGNTGIWQDNRTPGFAPVADRTGASLLDEYPRAAGKVTMADDTAFIFRPARKQGTVVVWSDGASTLYAMAQFIAVGTAACSLIAGATTANAAATTGTLSGTTGTDTKFTLSARNNGTFYFENRLGSSIDVDFASY